MARTREITPKLSKLIQRISTNLERMRQDRGWTQAETAERAQGDLRWYQRLESGKHVLSLETISRLAQVFKVDAIDFFKE